MTSDEDIKQLKKSQEDLGRSLEEKQRTVQQLQDQLEDLDDKIQNLLENKQKVCLFVFCLLLLLFISFFDRI